MNAICSPARDAQLRPQRMTPSDGVTRSHFRLGGAPRTPRSALGVDAGPPGRFASVRSVPRSCRSAWQSAAGSARARRVWRRARARTGRLRVHRWPKLIPADERAELRSGARRQRVPPPVGFLGESGARRRKPPLSPRGTTPRRARLSCRRDMRGARRDSTRRRGWNRKGLGRHVVGPLAGGANRVQAGIVFVSVLVLHDDGHDRDARRVKLLNDPRHARPTVVMLETCSFEAMAQELCEAAVQRGGRSPSFACRGRSVRAPPAALLLSHRVRGDAVIPPGHAERVLRWEPKEGGRRALRETYLSESPCGIRKTGLGFGARLTWSVVSSRAIRAATPFAVSLASQRYPWNALLDHRPYRLMMSTSW